MKKVEMYRQGDILLKKIEKIDGKKVCEEQKILAYGEVTGHKHVLKGKGVKFFETEDGQVQVQVEQTAQLMHEEHHQIDIEQGNYLIVQQREFDLVEGVRQVAD